MPTVPRLPRVNGRRRAVCLAAIGLVGWTVFGVLSAGQILLRESGAGRAPAWSSVYNIVYFYWAWALVTPLVLRATDVIGSRGREWRPAYLAHVGAGVGIIVLQSALYAVFQVIDERTPDGLATLTALATVRHAAGNALTYASIALTWAGFRYYQRSQRQLLAASEAATRAVELEATLAQVRLAALITQLRPHVLFNTLNIISALVARGDPVAANDAIARLGSILRATLDTPADRPIPLRRELDLLRSYLEIARLRFGPRLIVRELVEEATLDAPVPPFLLQPIVENAVLHGAGARSGEATIDVGAKLAGDRLVLEVRDDGPGFGPGEPGGGAGLGMTLVRDRLQQVYGRAASMTARNAAGGGVSVVIELPLTAR